MGLLDMTISGQQEPHEEAPAGWPQFWAINGAQSRTAAAQAHSGSGSSPGAPTISTDSGSVRKENIVPATLMLQRETPGVVVELRRGRFEILLDGRSVGTIDNGDTVEQPVDPGKHTLQIRRGRYSSREHSFHAADREVVRFRCRGALLWPIWLASFIKPNLGIWLSEQEGSHAAEHPG